MRVGIYLETAPKNDKQRFLEAFGNGVKTEGDKSIFIKNKKLIETDIALIFGFYGKNIGDVQKFRKKVFEYQNSKNKYCIFLDADLLRYAGEIKADKASDPSNHLRVSYKSIFPDEAFYFNENSPEDRWNLLCKRKKITVKPYRKKGDHILICMNSSTESRGWSSKGEDTNTWLKNTIIKISKITDRPILIRFHPNEKEEMKKNWPYKEISKFAKNEIKFSGGIIGNSDLIIQNTDLAGDCENAWASIVFTTSAAVIPIINGIPVFTSRKDCIAYNIANHKLQNINEPELIDREQWFYNLAYSLWNAEEMNSGIVWERFRNRINDKGEISKKSLQKLGLV